MATLVYIANGGGLVTSVFNRVGAVVAEDGDYLASQVANDSSVPGDDVAEALDGLNADVQAAQSDANTALIDAATAQGVADDALSAANAAQATADAHAANHARTGSDPITGDTVRLDYIPNHYTRSTSGTSSTAVNEIGANAAGIDNKLGVIVNDVITAQSTADDAASVANSAYDLAVFAEGDAGRALVDAAEAQSTANTAVTNAAAAQSTANTAVTNAAAAQTTANTAVTNAAAAQSTANTAVTNAAAAQSTANTALANAATAQATADAAGPPAGGYGTDASGKIVSLKVTTATVTDAATIAVDASTGPEYKLTIGGNRTMGTPTNAVEGRWIKLVVLQDGTGGRTLSFPAGWVNVGLRNQLAQAAGASSLVMARYLGTTWYYAIAHNEYANEWCLRTVATTTYSLTLADFDGVTMLEFTNASGCTVTVPSGLAVPAGRVCACVQVGAAQVTFTASGTTIEKTSSLKTSSQNAMVALIARTAANTFRLFGETE